MILLLLLLVLVAGPVRAQTTQVESPEPTAGFWAPIGLQGEEVRAVSADPANAQSLYAATRDGVYRMAGGSWYPLSKDLADASFYSLCIISKAGSGPTLYAGTRGVLYEGTSDGRNWDSIMNEVTGPPFYAIAISASGDLYAGNKYGVMRRAAGAEGWDTEDNGMTQTDVRVIATDPKSASIVYVGTADGGIFKSMDSGKNWTAINRGISSTSISALAIDSGRPARVFAGSSTGVLFFSSDSGASWKPVPAGVDPGAIQSILVDPANSSVVYAGTQKAKVIRSVDGGQTWKPLSDGLNPANEKIVLASVGNTIYAGTSDGVYIMLQDAAKIAAAKKKAAQQPPTKQAEAPPPKVSAPVVRAIAIDPATPSTLYIGTSGKGILKSIDGGKTWTQAGEVDADAVVSLAIDPMDSSVIYAGTRGKFLKSSDAGETWKTLLTDLANPYFYAAVTKGTVYRANEFGVHRSTNRGEDWTDTRPDQGIKGTRSIAVDAGSSVVFAGTGDGVFRSENGGDSWTACGKEAHGPMTAIVLLPSGSGQAEAAPMVLFAASDGSGIFRSMDNGRTWQPANEGLSDLSVQTLAIDPRSRGVLYAGTFGSGIFKSTDAGKHWREAGSGLLSKRVRALVVDPSQPSTIYAGTEGGVFKSTDAGKTWKRM